MTDNIDKIYVDPEIKKWLKIEQIKRGHKRLSTTIEEILKEAGYDPREFE